MKNDLWSMLLLGTLFLLLFGLAELLYQQLKVKAEFTRKLVHIGTGIICLLFPVLITSHWSVFILCGLFTLVLGVSIKFGLLKSIHAIDRKSVGSLAYPAAVYLCFLAQALLDKGSIFYYLPLLTLALCDPMAALSGKKWPYGSYSIFGARKTLLGSAVFFVCAFITVIIIGHYLHEPSLHMSQITMICTLAFVVTIAEACSKDGYDNISIPVSSILSMYVLFP
ncbi:phosphatidate cytidylyltransferase [Sphingobacterium sp.]|uniref:phosphatidate cytidylyltransferase n=1 Tax=Sphingobacterium sp. TaxID=341027 RepID=UPI00289C3F77|nr:phosphatidate cytidylyltransferase [Sphingobacterium sp.]